MQQVKRRRPPDPNGVLEGQKSLVIKDVEPVRHLLGTHDKRLWVRPMQAWTAAGRTRWTRVLPNPRAPPRNRENEIQIP